MTLAKEARQYGVWGMLNPDKLVVEVQSSSGMMFDLVCWAKQSLHQRARKGVTLLSVSFALMLLAAFLRQIVPAIAQGFCCLRVRVSARLLLVGNEPDSFSLVS